MNKFVLYILFLVFFSTSTWAVIGASVDPHYSSDFHTSSFYTTDTPVQTGIARRSSAILSTGIYELPTDLTETSIYNVGHSLPIFTRGDKRFVFVRGINDFFTNKNYIWASDNLSVDGQLGDVPLSSKLNDWIDYNGIDVIVEANSTFSKIIRKHDDKIFVPLADAGAQLPIGPMWTTDLGMDNPSESGEDKYFEFEVNVDNLSLNYAPNSTDSVSLNLGFYDREATGSNYQRMKVEVNPETTDNYGYGTYEAVQGEKVFKAKFPLSYFYNDAGVLINPVKIKVSQLGNTNKLNFDFCELKFPLGRKTDSSATPEMLLVDNPTWSNLISQEKLMVLVKAGFSGEIKVKNAVWALDVTEIGKEIDLVIEDGSVNLTASDRDRVLFFSVKPQGIEFGQEKNLERLDLSSNDYVAIAQDDSNYFTSSTLGQGLYSTWASSGMNAELTEQGFSPALVKLEDIVDVYGGGLVSSQAIVNFLNAKEQQNVDHVCLVGSSSVDPKGLEGGKYPPFLGIPAMLHYGSQVGYIYSDDCYAKNGLGEVTRAVGRLLVYNRTELEAWISKRLNFEPGEFINLVSGDDSNGLNSFADDQTEKLGLVPASLILCGENLPRVKPGNLDYVWRQSISENGTNLSFYQGHGAMGYLSSADDKVLSVESVNTRASLSCFVLATCDAGRYFMHNKRANYNFGGLTIGGRINLSYILQNGKKYEAGQDSIGITPTSNGAVNLIASTGLAEEHWENEFTRVMLETLHDNPSLDWGELLKLKYKLDQNDSSISFHLFGDPAMPVFKKNPRRLLFSNQIFNNGLPLAFTGNWGGKQIEIKYKNYSLSSGDFLRLGSVGQVYEDDAMISLTLGAGFEQEVYGQLDYSVGNYQLPIILGLSSRFTEDSAVGNFVDSDNDGLDDQWEMATFGSLTFSNGRQDSNGSGTSDYQDFLEGYDAYAFSLELNAGWNLISLPCRLDADTEHQLSSYINSAFYYDTKQGHYQKLDLTEPFPEVIGFWVFSFEDRPVLTFKGTEPLNRRLNFESGWNLFGSRFRQEVPQADDLGQVFGWDQAQVDYYQFLGRRELILPLKGYWIKKYVSE